MADFTVANIRRREWFVVVTIAAFVGLIAAGAALAGGDAVLGHIARLSPSLIALMLLLSLANYVLRAFRWQLFSAHLGVAVPWRRTLTYYIAGFSLATTPGKVGETLRLWFLERCHGHRYERLAPLFVADRVGDLNAVVLLCLVGFAAFAEYGAALIAAALLALIVTLGFARPRLAIAAVGGLFVLSGRRWSRLFARLRSALRLTARLFSARLFSAALGLALLGWFAECLAFFLLLSAFGASVTITEAVFVFSFSMLVGTLLLLPGGLGGTEAAMVALLAALGVDLGAAVAATAVIRVTTLWFAVGLGFAAMPVAMNWVRQAQRPKGQGPARAVKGMS